MSSTPQPAVLTLSRDEMRARALAFAKRWAGSRREEAEAKSFLDEFFAVFGRDRLAVDAVHEYRVERPGQGEGRVDLLWPGKLLVEMKSTGRDLATAAQQAFDYLPHIDSESSPRWVLVSDFARFALYDLGEDVHDYLQGLAPPRAGKRAPVLAAAFTLDELPSKLRHFAFIRDEEQALFQTQPEVNLKAVALLGELHDALKASGYSGHALERLLVRVLFCLFAEDTDIFPWNAFTRFVEKSARDGADLGLRLGRLFQLLDTPDASRSPHLAADYQPFPYINGDLFDERLDLADTTAAHRAALLQCCRFDWSQISPGIFGSLFQGVMEPRERREKGAHYTSEENIRRVIDPLFLDDLRAEFKKICSQAGREKRLQQFHDRLASLRFLDPACGCGNFLVVAYRELRTLELDVLRALYGDQLALGLGIGDIARVNVDQFYGIEIEEFPVRIAETALWLTDHQVNMTFSKTFGKLYTRIPLKKSPTIVFGNALRLDWNDVLPARECSFVMGNPPFIGAKYMSETQRVEMEAICGRVKNHGLLDYVTAWYVKAAAYLHTAKNNPRPYLPAIFPTPEQREKYEMGKARLSPVQLRAAFVSTNSITQGEQPAILWRHLFAQGLKIHFAHRTFVWRNEASGKAHVHCVVIGFGLGDAPVKRLFETAADGKITERNGTLDITPYLVPGGQVIIENRSRPLCDVPSIGIGNKPIDDGNYLFTPKEKAAFLEIEPAAAPYFRRWIGAEEFINGVERWCLWLGKTPDAELRNLPECKKRIAAVEKFRLASKSEPTRKLAKTPTRFHVENLPDKPYLVIPKVSSGERRYIPIGFVRPAILSGDALLLIPNATLYHFGVLTSAMHMAWVRAVAGRLKSDYRYSASIVYNNFPWPEPDDKKRARIEEAAQRVLDLRIEFGDGRMGFLPVRGTSFIAVVGPPGMRKRKISPTSLGSLYSGYMQSELIKAHDYLDRMVDRAYRATPFHGYSENRLAGAPESDGERERVEFLFARYETLTSPLAPAAKKRPARRKTPAKTE
ncbi:MAG: hypothetical protein LBM92_08760 [Opitutaceae bacterium]|jgi:hypothetical protein|nr:hypothetical protein [Opitutaceae bacterium]